MKNLRNTLLLIGLLTSLAAASVAPDDAVILSIRDRYNQAKELMRLTKDGPDKMETTIHYEEPGKGKASESIQFFFNTVCYGENCEYADRRLYFVTRQLKLAGKKYYEEYLYDKNGQLAFALEQGYDDKGNKTEKRFYYQDGEFYQMSGPAEEWEHYTMTILADDYRHSFDNLIRNAKE